MVKPKKRREKSTNERGKYKMIKLISIARIVPTFTRTKQPPSFSNYYKHLQDTAAFRLDAASAKWTGFGLF